MFRDAKEELQRLEAELLEDEAREEARMQELAARHRERQRAEMGVRFFDDAAYDEEEAEYEAEDEAEYYSGPSLRARGRNSDSSDVDMDEYTDAVYRGKSTTGPAVVALLLIAAIFGALAWLVTRYGL